MDIGLCTDGVGVPRFRPAGPRDSNQSIPTSSRSRVPQLRGALASGFFLTGGAGRNSAGSTMTPLSETPQ
jgi:hypothetical protein